ncbi:DsbA family oxidoreductase [Streptomyces sp. NPDC050095]|uniref:DsbA family oxidoreductase n=1 Tax=unclassified Streptomyces TaxID=2593676 RepID=UPI0034191863
MRIDFWADVICPWCYLGHARLRTALDRFPHRDAVRVVHRSFELDPGRAKGDVNPVPSFLTARYGPDAAAMDERVARIAHGEGLGYRTDRQVGSTLDAHRLLHWAGEQHRQEQLLQTVMRANFAQARDIFTLEGLLAIVGEAGLDAAEATAALADPQRYLALVREDEAEAVRRGARGVPYVVIDDTFVVEGGQSAEAFLRALEAAWAESSQAMATPAAEGMCTPEGTCSVP